MAKGKIHICVKCNKEYIAGARNQKTCPVCRAIKDPTKVYSKICKVCGKEFETVFYNQEYCGLECKRTAHWEPMHKKKVCRVCSEIFDTTNRKVYCSKICAAWAKYSLGDYSGSGY